MRGLAVILLALLASCGTAPPVAKLTDALSSTVAMNDPGTSVQMVSGFSDLQSLVWRWTRQHFQVVLQPPASSQQRGAKLQFQFRYPQTTYESMGQFTLSTKLNGHPLDPQVYKEPGDYLLEREIPAAYFEGNAAVLVDFSTDKIGHDKEDQVGLVAIWFKLVPHE